MKTLIIVGAQWGDEGKGKIVDVLTQKADVVVRYAGGNNAGHTVVVGDKTYKFHLLPSGIINQDKLNVIGNGTVLDTAVLTKEIEQIEQAGFTITAENLNISSTAHVILDSHREADNPDAGHSKKIGTTGRGIGPCYMDKIKRTGTRLGEYVAGGHASRLKPLVKDTAAVVNKAIDTGKKVVFEGAQGALLDIDHGTYPFVTSSNPIAGGAMTGAGVGPTKIDGVVGIFKAYVTRVGEGPFPTELGTYDETKEEESILEIEKESKAKADALTKQVMAKANAGDAYNQGRLMRMQGYEYGTTTGRPRRTGWFDAVAGKYSVMINGMTSFVITKLDVLQHLKEIKICTSYGNEGEYMMDLNEAKPTYISMPGWDEDISGCTSFSELPKAAQAYVEKLEELLGIKASFISVGPKRSQTITQEALL